MTALAERRMGAAGFERSRICTGRRLNPQVAPLPLKAERGEQSCRMNRKRQLAKSDDRDQCLSFGRRRPRSSDENIQASLTMVELALAVEISAGLEDIAADVGRARRRHPALSESRCGVQGVPRSLGLAMHLLQEPIVRTWHSHSTDHRHGRSRPRIPRSIDRLTARFKRRSPAVIHAPDRRRVNRQRDGYCVGESGENCCLSGLIAARQAHARWPARHSSHHDVFLRQRRPTASCRSCPSGKRRPFPCR